MKRLGRALRSRRSRPSRGARSFFISGAHFANSELSLSQDSPPLADAQTREICSSAERVLKVRIAARDAIISGDHGGADECADG